VILDHACDARSKHGVGGIGTPDTVTLDNAMRSGPISLTTALEGAFCEVHIENPA
jgi:hypothetical protein